MAVTTTDRAGVLAACLRVDAAGAEIRDAFAARGIECVLLKGRGLARRLYDHVWERPYSDTDLLIRFSDRRRAESLLAEAGYERVDRDGDLLGAAGYAHTFARADGALIDLHWNLAGVGAPADATWAAVRRRTVPLAVGGRPARVPNDEATALIVALHNAHHGARRAGTALDVARARDRISGVAWVAAGALADELGAGEAFAAGLALAGAAHDVMGPAGRALPLEYRLRAYSTSYGVWALHRIRAARGGRARVQALVHVAVPPAGTMRQFFPLARRGRGGLIAAYLLRPLRLAAAAPASIAAYRRAMRESRRQVRGRGDR